jgi:Tat protein translocase TatB subunit
MFGIGMPELILIAVIALIVVGPKNLPSLAKSLGKGLNEFRRAADDVTDNIRETIRTDELKKDVDDFKNSLLYGKQAEAEPPRPADPAPPAPDRAAPAEDPSSPPH